MEMAYPEDVRNMAAEALRVWLYEWMRELQRETTSVEWRAQLLMVFPYDNIRDILWDRIEPFEEPPLATHTT
jgi:hypothetical protein